MTGEQKDLIARPTEAVAAPPADALNPLALIQQALASGVDVASLEKLQAMAERHEEREARKAFFAALSAFQADASTIPKARIARVHSQRTGNTNEYAYANLDDIIKVIRPLLLRHGLSHSWDSATDGSVLTVTCYVRHVLGHEEHSQFSLPSNAGSPMMSEQQKVASALSYAKRYSLVSALGLSVGEPDTDGAGDPADALPITDEQLGELTDRLNSCGADLGRFKAYMGVGDLADIPRGAWPRALKAVEAKERAAGDAS